ncbi:SPL family radical SAM protein [Paenibacillus jiagnxiensis]|uniref:SPL family radical SAM protein n=1 Tax=Paenibacillus jiagnxiensis TaxID=3228926 RepID=UPI0033A212B1
MARKTYEQTTIKQTLNRVKAESMPFDWSINPYRGCSHGCHFCYARAFQSYIGKEADDEFQNHILMKMNAPEALEAQLSRMARKYNYDIGELVESIGHVAIGTATDPYQPVEGKTKITRECLKVLAKYRIPTSITTRSPLILRDLDVLKDMNMISVNISLGTLHTEIIRRMEPAAPLPGKRLETVGELSAAGIRTGLFIAPILPYLTDSAEDLNELFSAAQQHKASFAMTSILRLTPDVKAWFLHALEQHYPHLLPAYRKLYRGSYADSDYREVKKAEFRSLRAQYSLQDDVPSPPRTGHLSQSGSCPMTAFEYSASSPVPLTGPEVEQLSFQF